MYRSIETAKTFSHWLQEVSITNIKLSPSDVECITVFLTCSSQKKWSTLSLIGGYIQDHGIQILHRGLRNCNITVNHLYLNSNGLTKLSSSVISDITIRCGVEKLWISNNKMGGDDVWSWSMITDSSSKLVEMDVRNNKVSSIEAIKLFTALSGSKKLRTLDVSVNNISNETCDAIIMAMKKNTSLEVLKIVYNPISKKNAQLIVQALQHNNTLQKLYLNDYSEDAIKKSIRLSIQEVNKIRKNRVKLKIALVACLIMHNSYGLVIQVGNFSHLKFSSLVIASSYVDFQFFVIRLFSSPCIWVIFSLLILCNFKKIFFWLSS